MLSAIALTIGRLVPINNDVAQWDLQSLPQDWKTKRALWDKRHNVRIGMLLSSLAALAFRAARQ